MSQRHALYDYLRKECPDLASAKAWIWKWMNEWDQVLPWDTDVVYSLRAMCGHLSNVLEGGTATTGYAVGNMLYLDTQFGSELYHSACGDTPP